MNYGLSLQNNGEKVTYTLGGRMTLVSAGNMGATGLVGFTPLEEPAPDGFVPEEVGINSNFELYFTDTTSIDILMESLKMAKVAMSAFTAGTNSAKAIKDSLEEIR